MMRTPDPCMEVFLHRTGLHPAYFTPLNLLELNEFTIPPYLPILALSLQLRFKIRIHTMNKFEVIMVDDDADDIDMMREAFDAIHYSHCFVHFQSGKHFMDFLENLADTAELPSLIILDYNMPGLNGEDILARLRKEERFENITVVFFTTGISPQQQKKLESMGSVCCVIKPATYHEFLKIATEIKKAISEKTENHKVKAEVLLKMDE
jgi:CheY-like chemotaxis protein